jgi:hypothetical protein
MATVRFSGELVESIKLKANELFFPAIRAAQDTKDPSWGDRVYAVMLGEWEERMNALPSDFLTERADITVNEVKVALPELNFGGPGDLPFSRPKRWPNQLDILATPGLVPCNTYRGVAIDGNDPCWGTLPAEFRAYRDRIIAEQEKQQTFLEGVRQVLGAYTTLAPALKAWPPLWDLLPSDTQRRHKEIVERKKNDNRLEGVDLSGLTAAVTLSKLTR